MLERTITVTAPEQAHLTEHEVDHSLLAPNELFGRTLYTLISPGTELAVYRMQEGHPSFPGYASVFEVERIGAAVTDFYIGDRVFCMGPHRSYQRVPQEAAIKVPESVSSEQAAFVRLMGVSMTTLTTTKARPPQQMIVTGLGIVGNLAAQIFSACGYNVIACDPVERRRELVKAAGLRKVLERVPLDDPEVAGRCALVIDCSGHEQAVLDGCNAVARGGEVVCIGVPWSKRTDISAHALLHAVFHRYVTLRTGWEWEIPVTNDGTTTQNSMFANFHGAMRWLEQGRIRLDGIYDVRKPADIQLIYKDALLQKGERLTTVLDWCG